MISKARGFTLVETLVAATIMLLVLTSAFLAFQGAIIASAKAQERLELLSVVPLIRSEITNEMRLAGLRAGEGGVNGVRYSWEAINSASGTRINLETAGTEVSESADRQFDLWAVLLTVNSGGADREFEFTELTWSE